MQYKITNYSRKKAKKLNVTIKLSTNLKKKIDVFKNNKKICSIGNSNYNNFPTLIQKKGISLSFAKFRRKLYKKRHSKDRNKGCGFYADKILW
jgi:hypothetical protein